MEVGDGIWILTGQKGNCWVFFVFVFCNLFNNILPLISQYEFQSTVTPYNLVHLSPIPDTSVHLHVLAILWKY